MQANKKNVVIYCSSTSPHFDFAQYDVVHFDFAQCAGGLMFRITLPLLKSGGMMLNTMLGSILKSSKQHLGFAPGHQYDLVHTWHDNQCKEGGY